jgi:hypothetical protein
VGGVSTAISANQSPYQDTYAAVGGVGVLISANKSSYQATCVAVSGVRAAVSTNKSSYQATCVAVSGVRAAVSTNKSSYQATCVAVGGVRAAVHVPGGAAPLHLDLSHLGPGTRRRPFLRLMSPIHLVKDLIQRKLTRIKIRPKLYV